MSGKNTIARLAGVRLRTGLSKTLIYEGMKRGTFPSCIKLSDDGRAVGWLESELDAWIEHRIGKHAVSERAA